MKWKVFFLYLLITGNMVGCASNLSNKSPNTQNITPQSTSLSELEIFMAFATRFSSLTSKAKEAECNRLRFEFNVAGDWSAGWALSYGISVFPACGTIAEGLDILHKIHDRQHQANSSLWLFNQQISLFTRLKKLETQKKWLEQSLELSQKQLQSILDDKNTMASKLLELKTIETSINQRLEKEQNEAK